MRFSWERQMAVAAFTMDTWRNLVFGTPILSALMCEEQCAIINFRIGELQYHVEVIV
jgi:hypothetical protein